MKWSALFFLGSLFLVACQPAVPAEPSSMDHASMGHSMHLAIESDRDFLELMIPHHEEAVESSKLILDRSQNEALKLFAEKVIAAQDAEITQMMAWGTEWYGDAFAVSQDYELMMGDLNSLEGEALDTAYMEGMVAHHEGAIAMAEMLQSFTDRKELQDLSGAILETQTAEVEQLKAWLKK